MLSDANSGELNLLIATSKSRLVIFDFGGTIYDFTPVHVECFIKALECCGSPIRVDLVNRLIIQSIRTGEDSFSIAGRLVKEFSLTLNSRDLAVQKRLFVEEKIASTTLEESPKEFIQKLVRDQISVAIITRGMEQSVKRIVENTWPKIDLAAEIPIFGRTELSEVVDKRVFLRSALSHFGLLASQSLFVGDSMEDAEIARVEHLTYFDLNRT